MKLNLSRLEQTTNNTKTLNVDTLRTTTSNIIEDTQETTPVTQTLNLTAVRSIYNEASTSSLLDENNTLNIEFTEGETYNLDDIIFSKKRDNKDCPLIIKVEDNNTTDKAVLGEITKLILTDYGISYSTTATDSNYYEKIIYKVPNFYNVFTLYFNRFYNIYYKNRNALVEGSISLNSVIETIQNTHDDVYEAAKSNNVASVYEELLRNKPRVDFEYGTEPDGSSYDPDSIEKLRKELYAHINNKSNPHVVTKEQVGLGLVVNKGMDSVVTEGSENYISSGAVYNGLLTKQDTLIAGENVIITPNAETHTATISAPNNAYTYIHQLDDYLFEVQYSTKNIDYDYANNYFKNLPPTETIGGACTGVYKDGRVLRQLDWTYDNNAEFVVRTNAEYDKNKNIIKHATIGIASSINEMTKDLVQSGVYSRKYKMVPFIMTDGINDAGVYIQSNVVPYLNFELNEGSTYGECCITMVARYILDHCATFDEIETFFNTWHIYGTSAVKYNYHFLIAIGNVWKVIEITATGHNTVTQGTGVNQMPYGIMTNFRTTGLSFSPAQGILPPNYVDWNTVENYGIGVERYDLVTAALNANQSLESLRPQLMYTKTYTEVTNPWRTEFTDEASGLKVMDAINDPSKFDAILTQERAHYVNRNRNEGANSVWQTVHSAIYDLNKKHINLVIQERTNKEFEFGLFDHDPTKQDLITPENKLSSDLVDDTNHTNKFVTESQRTQIGTNAENISEIQAVIPDDATSSNKLTTEEYVRINGGKIDKIFVNGTEQTITNKEVHIEDVASAAGLATEIATRTSQVNTLTSDLNTEKETRATADTTLQTAIQTEKTRAESAETTLGNRVTAVENVIPEDASTENLLATEDYVDTYGGKIDKIFVNGTEQTITNKEVRITDVASAAGLATEISNRTTADQTLQANIDAEASTRSAADILINERLDNVERRGRFLTIWYANDHTMKTYPQISIGTTYTFKAGDYFIVGTVGSTNYKPKGSGITRTGESQYSYEFETETEKVTVNSTYLYDGTTWNLLSGGAVPDYPVKDVTVNGTTVVDTTDDIAKINIKNVNGTSLLGSGNVDVRTYQPYKTTWRTDTIDHFCADIVADADATVGMAYSGTLKYTSGLPTEVTSRIAEVNVQVMGSSTTKVLWLTCTSSDYYPYHWEQTYYNGSGHGWRSFIAFDSDGKASADKLKDGTTNKLVTQTEKNTWNAKQDALVSGTNIKTVNGNSLLGSGNIAVKTYQPFPNGSLSGSLEEVVAAIMEFPSTAQGMAYLGGIAGTCTPFGYGNVECTVTFMIDGVAVLEVNSSNMKTHSWFYNTASNDYTWRTVLTDVSMKTVNGENLFVRNTETPGNIDIPIVSVSNTGTSTTPAKYITVDETEYKLASDPDEYTTKLKDDLYAYTNIGKITASKTNPVKVADAGDPLKDVFNAILGTEEDTNPTISQSGTTFTKSAQSGTINANGGEVGLTIASQTGIVTFKVTNTATCSYGLKAGANDTYHKTGAATTFVYPIKTRILGDQEYQIKISYPALNGCSISVTSGTLVYNDTNKKILYCKVDANKEVKVSISMPTGASTTAAQTRFGQLTADVEFANAQYNGVNVDNFWTYLKASYTAAGMSHSAITGVKSTAYTITAGAYYTYYKTTDDPTTGSTGWTSVGSTSITDIVLTANAGQYIWLASTQNKTALFEWNDVSGKYNTDATATTKTANQTIHTNTGLDVSSYYTYRTAARSGATNKKFKLQ